MKKNNLKKIRGERMLSKAELARKAGISVLTVNRIEQGYPCQHATKRKILAALGIEITERELVFPDQPEENGKNNTSAPENKEVNAS
ncbi:helix-turn-helix domain-containing protein [Patescibacteria group bacterium]|nr:helix-turn-helix domain-containing protein [Patescibacteria group bacterium]